MNQGANVSSVEAIDGFRAEMIECMTKVLRALDDVSDRAKRTKLWLENDRLPFWQQEIRKRARRLEQAQQELYQARLSQGRDLSLQQMLVRKATRAMEEAEEKIAKIKKWQRDFDPTVAPLQRPVDRMRDYLAELLPKGILSLMKAAESLDSYRHTVLTSGAVPGLDPAAVSAEPSAPPAP